MVGCAPNDLVVVKFGGSVLNGPPGFLVAGRLVLGLLESGLKPVVVVSAVKGVTDALLSSFERRDPSVGGAVGKTYLSIARELGLPPESVRDVSLASAEVSKLLWAAEVLGQWTPRVRDLVVSYGERLSAALMAGLLRRLGVEARWLGGEAGIVTDGEFGDATPLYGYTEGVIRERLEPMLEGGVVPVVAGFTGATREGDTTLLGRGGSDLTATLLASALGAGRIVFYTDVPGILSGDPRVVGEPRRVGYMSYEEAWEVARLGLRKFHPRTFEPLIAGGLGVEVVVSDLRGRSTMIGPGRGGPPLKVVSLSRGVARLVVRGPSMAGKRGFLSRLAGLLAGRGVNILAIRQPPSETAIELVVDERDLPAAVEELGARSGAAGVRLEVERGFDIVSIVGWGAFEALPEALSAAEKTGGRLLSTGELSPSISILARGRASPELARLLHRRVVESWVTG
ncbi:aspartate kinase, monofunctional class [Aeropyrum pernix]|uniref:aspartate kinase, monofunctional class n=1 Tax=Aeropyrum pernix TaxID=56636 RepID=UPI001A948FFF|nr:aspartate kinase, monofunctional class [Aeropyrum pernix]